MLPSHVQIHYLHLKCSRSNAISKLIFGWKLKGKHTRDLLFALYGWERFWVRERDSLYPCERVRERECIWERESYIPREWLMRKKENKLKFYTKQIERRHSFGIIQTNFQNCQFLYFEHWLNLLNKQSSKELKKWNIKHSQFCKQPELNVINKF